MRMNVVYHFTCAGCLPWIIAAGELRAGRNQKGNFPKPDFLWATTDRRGDRTASAWASYRKGSALVRLTLHADDFELWPDIVSRFPQWTPNQSIVLKSLYIVTAKRRFQIGASALNRCRCLGRPILNFLELDRKAARARTFAETKKRIDGGPET
jgi:hypothetical protein